VVGGKGANLAGMAAIGLPVPPGFTISAEICAAYAQGEHRIDDALREEVAWPCPYRKRDRTWLWRFRQSAA
jgi:pyruvate,orthophosphate dikinase